MKCLRILWKLLRAGLVLLLSLLILLNMLVLVRRALWEDPDPRVMGYSWAVVLTGSMEPVISGNDVVITKEMAAYEPGDIIMFQSGSTLITHRIVEEGEAGFITKGDANNTNDADPVQPEDIVGKVVRIIPYMGVVLGYLKTIPGMCSLVLLALLFIEVPYLLDRIKNEEEGCDEHER